MVSNPLLPQRTKYLQRKRKFRLGKCRLLRLIVIVIETHTDYTNQEIIFISLNCSAVKLLSLLFGTHIDFALAVSSMYTVLCASKLECEEILIMVFKISSV